MKALIYVTLPALFGALGFALIVQSYDLQKTKQKLKSSEAAQMEWHKVFMRCEHAATNAVAIAEYWRDKHRMDTERIKSLNDAMVAERSKLFYATNSTVWSSAYLTNQDSKSILIHMVKP